MSLEWLANVLVLAGLSSLVGGAWVIHPAAGLIVAGAVSVALGIGIVRMVRNDSQRTK